MKRFLLVVKEIFTPPKIDEGEPRLKGRGIWFEPDMAYNEREETPEMYRERIRKRQEEHKGDNEAEIQIATFYVQRAALQKTLNIAYGSLLTSTLAVFVALAAVIVSIVAITGSHSSTTVCIISSQPPVAVHGHTTKQQTCQTN